MTTRIPRSLERIRPINLSSKFLSTVRPFARRHPVWMFLVLAFGFTWIFWALAALRFSGESPSPLIIIGALGPAYAALLLSRTGEREANKKTRNRHRRALAVAFGIAGIVLILRVVTGGTGALDDDSTFLIDNIEVLDIILLLFAVYLVAVVLSSAFSPDPGIRNRMRSLLDWRRPVWAWAFAFFVLPLIMLAGLGLGYLQGAEFSDPPVAGHPWREWLPLLLVSFLTTAIFTGGLEEPGWRGFMLPELQKGFSPLSASLFIAIAWSIWHLPLHIMGFYGDGDVIHAMLSRTVRMIPLTILYTWFYNRSGGSLLLMVVLHAVSNNYSTITPMTWWAMVPAIILAGGLIIADRMWRPWKPGPSV